MTATAYNGFMVDLTRLVDATGRVHSYHAEYGTQAQGVNAVKIVNQGPPVAALDLGGLIQTLSCSTEFKRRCKDAGGQAEVISCGVSGGLSTDVRKVPLMPEELEEGKRLILGLLQD